MTGCYEFSLLPKYLQDVCYPIGTYLGRLDNSISLTVIWAAGHILTN